MPKRAAWWVLPAIVVTVLFAAVTPSGAADTTKTVEINPARVYTPTNITVHKGDRIEISAEGKATFGGGELVDLGPDGIPWGPRCATISDRQHLRGHPWPAKGVACWSVIARIGRTGPVAVGKSVTFTADKDGPLRVGVNDNFPGDNTGSFTADVKVTPAADVAAGASNEGGGSKTGLFVIIGVVVLLALGLLLFFLWRRRGDEDDDGAAAEPTPEPAPIVAPVAAAAAPEPEPVPAAPAIPTAPPDPESIDVNIFEVEFVNGLQLRIGYNHFPDRTPVNWTVTQSRKPVAVGSFVAQGGGSTNHFETAALGVKLEGRETHPDGADVQFDWSVNGVPFRYSVRRDPNC